MNKTDKLANAMIKFCNDLANVNLTSENSDVLSYRLNDIEMLMTTKGINFKNISKDDIKVIKIDETNSDLEIATHSAIYNKNKTTNAICHAIPFNCGFLAEVGVSIPPILDDVAQIVGPSVKIANSMQPKDVLKALKHRNCCMVKDNGIIVETRTLNECYTACLVLEKGGKCFIEATVIAEPIPLSKFEATVMHYIYKNFYSKKNQKNKLEQEG